MAWCLERGKIQSYRIVLAGYDEYKELKKYGWTMYSWKTTGGYSNLGDGQGKKNKFRERLWMSPYCAKLQNATE